MGEPETLTEAERVRYEWQTWVSGFGAEGQVKLKAGRVLVTRIGGLKDTHKSWWECDTGIAFLVSGAPDWRTRRMTQVYDLSDPAHPVKIRDLGLPGQEPGSTGQASTLRSPGGTPSHRWPSM